MARRLWGSSAAGRVSDGAPGFREAAWAPFPGGALYDFGGRLLFRHENDVPGIAELARQLGDPPAGNANEIDMLQLGLAYVLRVRGSLAAMFTNIGFLELGGIAQMAADARCPATRLAHTRFLFHFRLLSCHFE